MLVQARHHLAQLLDLQGIPVGDALGGAEFDDLLQVATVSQLGMFGHLALIAQMSAISLQLAFHQRTGRRVWVKRGTTRPSTSAI